MKIKLLLALSFITILSQNSFAQPGSISTSFNTGSGTSSGVHVSAIQTDGKIIIAGAFTNYNGTNINRIARLNKNGTIDNSFNVGTGANYNINTLSIQNDGKIVIGGAFASYNGVSSARLARLNQDGSLDTSFHTGTGFNSTAEVYTCSIQNDGKLIIGGYLYNYGGTACKGIIRLNSTGTIDTSFHYGSSLGGGGGYPTVFSSCIQADGKIIIGGKFNTYIGVSSVGLARININGSIDTSFHNNNVGFNNDVYSLLLQPDGKILVGGLFTSYQGIAKSSFARINVDGSLDNSFPNGGSGPTGCVNSIALEYDGKIIAGGDFYNYNGISRNRIVRINPDGSLDNSFIVGTGFNGTVKTLSILPNRQIIAGGSFYIYNGITTNHILCLEYFDCNIPVNQNYQTLCAGIIYSINNHTYSTEGNYTDTLKNNCFCDSIIETHLSYTGIVINKNISLCTGYSVSVGSHIYNSTGMYSDTLTAVGGCDSIINTGLTVASSFTTNQSFTICSGEQIIFNGNTYFQTGIYYDTLTALGGCDSIIITLLIVNPVYSSTQNISITAGNPYIINGHNYSIPGTYNDTLQSYLGCDSIITTILSVNYTTPLWTWAKNNSRFQDRMIATDSWGNSYLAGNYSANYFGNIVFGTDTFHNSSTSSSDKDILLLKYDPNGNFLWAKTALGTGDNQVYSITTDAAGNIYLAGFSYTSSINFGTTTLPNPGAFIVKYDSNGNDIWAKSPSSTVIPTSIKTDIAGNVYLLGENYPGGTLIDVYLCKYNSAGTLKWTRGASGASLEDIPTTIATDAFGHIYITGVFNSNTLPFGSTTLHKKSAGSEMDMFLVKYDSLGNVIWAQNFAVGQTDRNGLITTDPFGNVYLSGAFQTSKVVLGTYTLFNDDTITTFNYDIFIAKYNSAGNVLWAKSPTGCIGGGSNSSKSIVADSSGVFITGNFDATNLVFDGVTLSCFIDINGNHGKTLFLGKYNTNGNLIWALDNVGANVEIERTNSISLDQSGNLYLTGSCNDPVVFPPYTLSNLSSNRTFIAKMGQGNSICSPVSINNPQSICQGEVYSFNGHNYNTNGTYKDTLQTYLNCDSIIVTQLTINPTYIINSPRSICSGQSITVGIHTYNANGTYTDSLTTMNGCDSIITTNLSVVNSITQNNTITLCTGQTITVGTHTYNSNGTYSDTLTAIGGCDSIITTHLTMNNVSTSNNPQTICLGASYIFNGHTYSTTNTYTDTLNTVSGCDSIIVTQLTVTSVAASVSDSIFKDNSQPYTWYAIPTYSSNITSARWDWGDGISTIGLYPSHQYSTAGIYNICVTAFATCGDSTTNCSTDSVYRITNNTTNSTIVNINVIPNVPTGMKSPVKGLMFNLMPNPTTDILTITLAEVPMAQSQLTITNMVGEKLQTQNLTKQQTVLWLDYPRGIYFISIDNGKEKCVKKVVIE